MTSQLAIRFNENLVLRICSNSSGSNVANALCSNSNLRVKR